jgi:hypothetical protein
MPQASIVVIIPVFCIGGQQANREGSDIHDQIKYSHILAKQFHEFYFHVFSKNIERIHVDGEVYKIGVNKTTGKKAIVLFSVTDGRRPKDEVVKDFVI